MGRLTELIKHYQQSVDYLAKNWDVTTRHMEMGEIRQHREHCQIEDDTLTFLIELQKYKDVEEQGRLVELPCRLGVTAWHIFGGEIEKDIVDGIEYTADGFVLYSDGIFLGTLGDVAFLTREEAKAKLAEKGGGSDETN